MSSFFIMIMNSAAAATCKWISAGGNKCKNVVLMDEHCSRHLKQKCSICFEQVRSTNSAGTKRLTCGHSFHHKCIIEWFVLSEICPVCRAPQPNEPLIKFRDKVEDNLRDKYRDAMKTYEKEIRRLKENLRRYSEYHSTFTQNQ